MEPSTGLSTLLALYPVSFFAEDVVIKGFSTLGSGGAAGIGAALAIGPQGGAQVNLKQVQFVDNKATLSGGAVWCVASDTTNRDTFLELEQVSQMSHQAWVGLLSHRHAAT